MADQPLALVVDEDQHLLDMLRAILVAYGYAVATTLKSAEVAGLVLENPPDVLLIDLRFARHGVDWDMLTSLRADPRAASLPIVAMTTDSAEAAAHRRALSDLRVALIHKPMHIPELLATVREAHQLAAPRPTPMAAERAS